MAPAHGEPEPQWPPRSPHEALLSTPGGRQRYRQMLNRTSPSPSPSRVSHSRSAHSTGADAMSLDDDEDEDEETLQLKLQELQARLKLKKLQNAKAKESGFAGSDPATSSNPGSSIERRRSVPIITSGRDKNVRPPPENPVEVPASPVKRAQAPQEQTSPRRVQLGIDKGLKAKDISLKRAPNVKRGSYDATQNDGYLRRSRTPNSSFDGSTTSRPQSFNERLASARTQEASNAEKQERIRQSRTKTFGIGQDEMQKYKDKAVDIPEEAAKAQSFSREEVLSTEWRGAGLRRSNTAPSVRSPTKGRGLDSGEGGAAQSGSPGESEGSFEPYSCIHLSRRILPHTVLARHVSGKKIMNIKDLLKEVKAPDYSLPDVEQDIVVLGIVAKKSEPRDHKPTIAKNGKKPEDRGRYMVMNISDLDYEVDFFLFNSAFERFWKLTEGTVIAILNPNVMPPPPGRQDTGRFSLVINSDEDTVLEIGTARDLGYCQSVKKDGNPCGSWVNKKRTNYCEYHTNEAVQKTRASRIELNSSGFGYGPKSKGSSGGRFGFGKDKDFDPKKKGPKNYDWETKTKWFATRSMSAADLIDGKDQTAEDRKERQAHLKRSLEAKEKEREMMRKLGSIGNGAGREYMMRAGSRTGNSLKSSISSSQADGSIESDAQQQAALRSLNLQGKDRTIHLSPIKRKRSESSQTGSVASKSSALGWGSGLKDKLSRMRDGEKLRAGEAAQPPVRKKTRFVTDKGIREAGRDSLGMDLSERRVSLDDDDDDELVILK